MTKMNSEETPGVATSLEAADPELAGCAGCCARRGPECTGRADEIVVSQVLVKFERTRRTAWYTHGQLDLAPGDRVVVETDRGTGVARVLVWPRRQFVGRRSLRRVLKVVSEPDDRDEARSRERDVHAYRLCLERIESRRLPMQLIGVEFPSGDAKAVFYFSAEGRIDFRDLVRDLARDLRLRIEMRQIGVRDQAKMTGGIGICGRELCCSSWLRDFSPVTIKMAKVQGLVLNPQKVSGQCGRLLCCLSYEHDQYKESRRGLPKPGAHVVTPEGEGRVRELDILRRRVHVSLESKSATFDADEVVPPGQRPPERKVQAPEEPPEEAPRARPEPPDEGEAATGDEKGRPARRRRRGGRRRGGGEGDGPDAPTESQESEAPAEAPGGDASAGERGPADADDGAGGDGDAKRRARRRRRGRGGRGRKGGDDGPPQES